MIVYPTSFEGLVGINVGRPDLYNEDDFIFWSGFQDWIRDSEMKIAVNNMFTYIDERIAEHVGYGGGGMKYIFWVSPEDVTHFKTKWKLR